MDLLLRYIDHENTDFKTALWYAAGNPDPACLKMLLAAGADPDKGNSPLTNAATGENARLLLDAGADPEEECEFETVLDTAIINKNFYAAIAMIGHGVDVRKGNPVVAAAKAGIRRFLLPVLKKAGADNWREGLQVAAGQGDAETALSFIFNALHQADYFRQFGFARFVRKSVCDFSKAVQINSSSLKDIKLYQQIEFL